MGGYILLLPVRPNLRAKWPRSSGLHAFLKGLPPPVYAFFEGAANQYSLPARVLAEPKRVKRAWPILAGIAPAIIDLLFTAHASHTVGSDTF